MEKLLADIESADPKIDEIAKICNFSGQYVHQLFRKHIWKTPGEYPEAPWLQKRDKKKKKMIIKCKYCLPQTGIEVPEFSSSDRNCLLDCNKQSPLRAILWIKDNFNLNLDTAKYIVTHINTDYGHCNRCAYNTLESENINCPQCGAFNFNWKKATEIAS